MKIYKTFPNGMEIVEYENSLAPAIADMWNRSGDGWGGSFGAGVWTAEKVISDHALGSFFNVYIAMKDGEALGYCSFDRYYKDEDTAYVHLLNVRPDCHGMGIGKELVLMCVEETIARGMPRLDIHTWAGNTKAVPLYKKCGFQWEERTDTTHLANFVPTVLSTELTRGFFTAADWYKDANRAIDLEYDGIKVNKFEFYEYSWEKDGRNLKVGFEKAGRRIRMIETDDYRIEMTAENHELAFGLSYKCRFDVTNKTDDTLNIEINGKSDKNIKFTDSWTDTVKSKASFEGTFFVDPIAQEVDPWRMHPCVLADVVVNGKSAEFGLGILPKFPIKVTLTQKRQVAKQGMKEDVYLSIKNDLPCDATVRFSIAEASITDFEQTDFDVPLTKDTDKMLATKAVIKGYGYQKLSVSYDITLDDGNTISFDRPLHLVNQGLDGQFAFETDDHYGAANGLWQLLLYKQDENTVTFKNLSNAGGCEFFISSLGMPYSDEFNIMEPVDVRTTQNDDYITFEAAFESKSFGGATLTEIYEFNASGILNRRQRITNTGQALLDLSIKTEFWSNIGRRVVYHYDGDFHKVGDSMTFGFDLLHHDKIDENWIFDTDNRHFPTGVYWPPKYKMFSKWGDLFMFEIPIGSIACGEVFETETIVYMCGVFREFQEFRNYVLGIHSDEKPSARNHLEMIANNRNPVLSTTPLPLSVRNNLLNIWEGEITVSSPDGLFEPQTQNNPDEEHVSENAFSASVSPKAQGIGIADFTLNLADYMKKESRALFITDDTRIITDESDGVYRVSNGKLDFCVSPGYSANAYSLKFGESEWLYSKYPNNEAYSWWNPFVGGLYTNIKKMGNSLVHREKLSAEFCTEKDSLGNIWSGVKVSMTVEKYDEYKGMRFEQFYMTLPGTPMICHFARLHNNAGRYLKENLRTYLFFSGKDGLCDMRADFTADDKLSYRMQMGKNDKDVSYDRLAAISRGGKSPAAERLYIFRDAESERGEQCIECNIDLAFHYSEMKGFAKHGGHMTTKPLFCIFTEKDLNLESLSDLSRIVF